MAEKAYIERETLQNKIKEICKDYGIAYGKHYGGFAEKIANVTNMISTADVQKVKHGKWEYIGTDTDKHENVFRCSNCASRIGMESETPYCPICEAKMDQE